jgi:hypothetical protein
MDHTELHASLDTLPEQHSKEEILTLIQKLQDDLDNDPSSSSLSLTQRVHRHANTNKELFFSYPMLFRSVCKGTYRPVVLDIIMRAKGAIDSGVKSKKDALEDVIKQSVDEVNAYRINNPK